MAFLILLYFFDSIIFVVSLIRCFVLIYLFTLIPLLALVCSFISLLAPIAHTKLFFIPFVCLSHSLLCYYLSFYSHSSSYSCSFISLLLLPYFFVSRHLIHFFARQRNESKKGDTGETLCDPFSRFSPVTPIRYGI